MRHYASAHLTGRSSPREVGGTLASRDLRVYLTGRLTLEAGGARLDEAQLPGRQGRLALAYLVRHRTRPVPRDDLAAAVWVDPPASAEVALRSLVSKLRGALAHVDGRAVVRAASGCYELVLPPATWVDVEVAANSLDEAEGALRADRPRAAWAAASVATAVLRRPFLPGEDAEWVALEREELTRLLVRAFTCLAEVWLQVGDAPAAVRAAQETVRVAPFREAGHRLLMRAHATAGDRAEAIRAYERCRRLLADELGLDPSPQTHELYLGLLRATPAP